MIPMSSRILFSRLTSDNCNLTKEHALSDIGRLVTTPSAHMTSGTAETIDAGLDQLPDIIRGLSSNQCLALGFWVEGAMNGKMAAKIVKAGKEDGETTISRSLKHFQFPIGQPALMYIDIDGSKMSMDEAYDELVKIDPALSDAEMVVTFSSSSHIYKSDGTCVRGEGSMHFFLVVSDGSRMKEYGKLLNDRLILGGGGFAMVDKSGKIWVRSFTDTSVWSPEREVFEATPVCSSGLISRKNDHIEYLPGTVLDIDDSISRLSLSANEALQLKLTVAELRKAAEAEAAEVAEAHRLKLARARAEKNQTSVKDELRVFHDRTSSVDSENRPFITVPASDWIMLEDGSEIQVVDILLSPESWADKTIPDIDEPYYGGSEITKTPGKQKAKIFVNYDQAGNPEVIVNSNAHGGILYKLIWDFKQLFKVMSETDADELMQYWKDFTDGRFNDLTLSAGELDDIASLFKDRLGKRPGSGVSSTKADVVKDLKPKVTSRAKAEAMKEIVSVEDRLWEMNKKYAVVGVGHTCRIYTEVFRPEIHKWIPVPKDKTALSNIYANQLVKVPNGNTVKEENIFDLWMEWEHRNTFHFSDMVPHPNRFRGCGLSSVVQQQEKDYDMFNLWQGYLCNFARATSCERILDHIKNVWCGGVEEDYEYLIKWIAHLFQKPADRCQTAIVFKGNQGSGKNIIIDGVIGRLLGVHYTLATKASLVTGRFNSLIANSILVFMNEALWSGDKSVSGVVKSQTTDDEIVIERKGIEAEVMRNYARYIYASNNEWVTGAEFGDRRFFYPTVSNHRVGDRQYFGELMAEIENGGRESFLDFMLRHVNLDGFNTADMPISNSSQKFFDTLQTEHPALEFAYNLFRSPTEILGELCPPNIEMWIEKPMLIAQDDLWMSFKNFCEDGRKNRNYVGRQDFFRQLHSYNIVNVLSHDMLNYAGCARTVSGCKYVEFVQIAEAKTRFAKAMKCGVPW